MLATSLPAKVAMSRTLVQIRAQNMKQKCGRGLPHIEMAFGREHRNGVMTGQNVSGRLPPLDGS